ncbi:MAG TPA: TATA-box-binding protein [archaeon]|nr:TATA-box-binding protein [archaeon]
MAKKTEKLVSKKNKPEVKKIEKKKAVALKETKDKEYRTEEKPISEKKKERSKASSEKSQGEIMKEDSPIIHLASDFKIKVENVVAFATFGVDIPLEKLVKEVENTEYEPEQFPGLVYRPTNPRAAALIFSSGKVVCTGAKSIENAKLAMQKVADTIRGVGINVPKKFPIEVENIVASSKIKAQLNLEEIAFMLENAEYEPEQFPGLVFRITEPRVAFLLFSSGKIICTGAHSIEDVNRALEKFKEKLEEIGVKVTPTTD